MTFAASSETDQVWVPETRWTATRVVVATFGVVAALAGVEHGVGEISQGWTAPTSPVIQSWPDTPGFEIVNGEPAMTVIPSLAAAGILSIVVAVALGIWAVWFVGRPHGGLVLVGLSALLLLVGGGFGPPLIGSVLGLTVMRAKTRSRPGALGMALANRWPWLLGIGVVGYLALVPGMVLVNRITGFDDGTTVTGLTLLAFAGLALSLVGARAHDQFQPAPGRGHHPAHPDQDTTQAR